MLGALTGAVGNLAALLGDSRFVGSRRGVAGQSCSCVDALSFSVRAITDSQGSELRGRVEGAMRRVHDLDAKDREILALLEADGRRSNSDIARLTSLSAPTVAERMARLGISG